MEISAMIVVFLVEVSALVLSFLYCRKRNSRFVTAKAELIKFFEVHMQNGTFMEHVEEILDGKRTVYTPKRSLVIYIWACAALLVGLAVTYLVVYYQIFGLWMRVIAGIVAITPAIYLLSSIIAEEVDENKIISFEKETAAHLLEKMKDGEIEPDLTAPLQSSQAVKQPWL